MKKEQKEIKKEYRDTLTQITEYEKAVEELERVKEKKLLFEQKAKDTLGKRYERYDELSDEIKAHQEMLTDVAMTTLMDGKTVEAIDEFGNKYEPIFAVRFKKQG
ncbi:MAG: hypothetical protein IPL87_03250 [Candidatus Moraniibacteriota bacterium]|nr:MAG: hypothetical protein IPL87_03250 [Candidatus Moranbacteria bacterium]